MQVVELSRAGYGANISLLMGVHRLRRKVFKDRLDWSVSTTGDLEMDRYDALDVSYLVVANRDTVLGCVRLLPTTGPTLRHCWLAAAASSWANAVAMKAETTRRPERPAWASAFLMKWTRQRCQVAVRTFEATAACSISLRFVPSVWKRPLMTACGV